MKAKLMQADSRALCESLARIVPQYKPELRELYKAPLGLTIEIEPSKTEKTLSQRNYFHMWCRKAAPELGYLSWENLKEDLKEVVLGADMVPTKMGTMERRIVSSENANREKYSELIDKLIFVAAEYGNFIVPPPPTQRENV